jgi:phosphoribosylanthranilate isomerase
MVEPSAGEAARAVAGAGLTHLQAVGRVDPALLAAACGVPVIHAVRVDGPSALRTARDSAAHLVLLDSSVPGRHGGTGTAFDWGLLERARLGRPVMLAGGLRPDTVGEAVRRTDPDWVDVSSGVEVAPGVKDLDRVEAFLAAARGVPVP